MEDSRNLTMFTEGRLVYYAIVCLFKCIHLTWMLRVYGRTEASYLQPYQAEFVNVINRCFNVELSENSSRIVAITAQKITTFNYLK